MGGPGLWEAWLGFIIAQGLVASAWLFVSGCSLLPSSMRAIDHRFIPLPPQDTSDKAASLIAVASDIDMAASPDEFPIGIVPVTRWDVTIKIAPVVLDLFTDLFTILNLVATDNPWFASMLAFVFSTSLTRELLEGTNLYNEVLLTV